MNDITENGTFCIMPWINLHVWPSGDAYLCCVSDTEIATGTGAVGNLATDNLAGIINGDVMKSVRKDMLAGKKNPRCQRCYEAEKFTKYSWRMGFNSEFQDTIDERIADTQDDGTITPKLLYVDFRFSNICNLECRTCGAELSSAIAKREGRTPFAMIDPCRHHPISFTDSNYDNFFEDELKQYLYDTQTFYFAGGEPLLQKEQYEILQFLVDNELFDKRLMYSTNLSTLNYKQFDIVDAWKKFDSVSILCSIDHFGDKLEYIRQGAKHDVIFKNLATLADANIEISLEVVVSIYNIYYLAEFFEYIDSIGKIDSLINIDLLYVYGDRDHPGLLPAPAKQELIEKINKDKQSELFNRLFEKFPEFVNTYNGLVDFINTDVETYNFDDFLIKIDKFDTIYNTDLTVTFPWLGDVITAYKAAGNE